MTAINPASDAWVTHEPLPTYIQCWLVEYYHGFPLVDKTGLLEAQRGNLPHEDEAEHQVQRGEVERDPAVRDTDAATKYSRARVC